MRNLCPSLFIATILLSITTSSFGQFGNENLITTEIDGAYKVFSCDIDGDGDIDVLSGSYSDDKIVWYENLDGNGRFSPYQIIMDISSTGQQISLYACDLDSDGDNDVVSAFGNSLVWMENLDGKGHFGQMNTIIGYISTAKGVYACDLDGDGDNDVLVASWGGWIVAWYENDGTGNFGPQQIISNSINAPLCVFSCDIDGDSDNDVLSCFSSNVIAWYENDGSGNFGVAQVISTVAGYPNAIYACDLDGDNDNDLVTSNYDDDQIVYYENTDGIGTFVIGQIIDFNIQGVNSVYAGDLDGDGDKDIVAGSWHEDKIVWYNNSGTGTFGSAQIINNTSDAINCVHIDDLDGDGENDVLAAVYIDNEIIWHKNTNATFGGKQVISSYAEGVRIICMSDVDNDGDNDILSASYLDNKIAWYENINGIGSYSPEIIISSNFGGPHGVRTCDVDGDGDSDVIGTSLNDNKIAWFENLDGLGTYGTENIISTMAYGAWDVSCIDIDDDGDFDIAAAVGSKVIWYENTNSLGNFGQEYIIDSTLNKAKGIFSCDLDGDGDNDVISASSDDDKIGWYENTDGLGNFGPQQLLGLADGARSVYSCDLDGDNDNDILAASQWDDIIAWYENLDGLGNFGPQQIITNNADAPYAVIAKDLDDDGDMDVLSASSSDDKIAWYENTDGNGSFSAEKIISITQDGAGFVYSEDVDNDGDYDVVSSCFKDDQIAWFENYLYNSPFSINGYCFYDENINGQLDTLEYGLGYYPVELYPDSLISFTNLSGEFGLMAELGSYVVSCGSIPGWELTTDSIEYHVVLSDTSCVIDSLVFGFHPDTNICNLDVSLTIGINGCDKDANLWINYLNTGTTNPLGVIELILDPQLSYVYSAITPDSIIGQNIYWNFDSLFYFSGDMIHLIVHTPDLNSTGDTLINIVNFLVTNTYGNNIFSDSISNILTCTNIINEKAVTPIGLGLEGIVSRNEILEYFVHFQNNQNDTIINVKIRDQIEENLILNSLQILSSSHVLDDVYIEQNRWLVFQFDSIMLPDSTTDFLGSQGFVKYRISIDSTTLPNEKIYNTADIYFDNNPAVTTNTVMNTMECYISPIPPDIYQTGSDLYVSTSNEIQWYLNDTMLFNANDTIYNPLQDGDYMVQVTDSNGCISFSDEYTYIGVGLEEYNETFTFEVYPNPTTGMIHFQIQGNANIEKVEVLDIKGNLIYTSNKLSPIDLSLQAKGIYFVKVITKHGVAVRKIVLR